jgi:pre-60S factor REI1
MESLSCQTAPGVLFASVDDLKAHYKTDWHRYNLKRKARRGGLSHL